MKSYAEFLKSKQVRFTPSGFDVDVADLNPFLFPFQRDIVKLALKMGKFSCWEKYGLGKTLQQLEWCNQVHKYTGEPVLILAPLNVVDQTVEEGQKFGIAVNSCRSQDEVINGINITNYEMLSHLDASSFAGVAIDEVSCIKNETSQRFEDITESFALTAYKTGWSATPSPNDYMELGSHAEYMGVMSRSEMLAMFFTHDGGDTSKWRLKGHAQEKFWEWVASWAVFITKPSDVDPSYDDTRYQLPPLHTEPITVDTEIPAPEGQLFFTQANTLSEQRYVAKMSLVDRCEQAAKLVNGDRNQWIVWCYTNAESELLKKLIPDAIEVKGSDSRKHKVESAKLFKSGECRVIVTKPSMWGYGLNLQNCNHVAYVGVNHSYEDLIQSRHRTHRFGQEKEVYEYVIYHHLEGAVVANIERKQRQDEEMARQMLKAMHTVNYELLHGFTPQKADYNPTKPMILPSWLAA